MSTVKHSHLESILHALKEFGLQLKDTFMQWKDRESFNNSTIIAYYSIFSLPGLLIIIINITGYFFDRAEVTTRITAQIQAIVGGDTAKDIEAIIVHATEHKGTFISSALGLGTLLFGATGVFYELQQMLNKIWGVKQKSKTRQKIWVLVRDRIFSFGLILVVGFLLLISLVLSAGLSAFSGWVSLHLSASFNFAFSMLDMLISVGMITFLFAALFKFLPDVKLKWTDVRGGALLTACLFVIAKFALGFYFGQSDFSSTYGAAGSIILIMLWVSYTGLILLFGAEFTHVCVNKYGKKIEPTSVAVVVPVEEKKIELATLK